MRWIRLLLALLKSKQKPPLSVNGISKLNFRVWITDIDVSIMNHAALFTIMEMGRIDLMVRSGFWNLAREHRWFFVSAAVNGQFFRPLKVFQRATLATRVFQVEEPWIYIEHRIERQGKLVATGLVKSKVKSGRETIPVSHILTELGGKEFGLEGQELVRLFEKMNRDSVDRWIETNRVPPDQDTAPNFDS